MANQRAEVVFEIDGEEYRRRPTFALINAIEASYGSCMRLLQKIQNNEIGVADTANMVYLILGGKDAGGPKRSVVQEAVFEDGYIHHLAKVAEFVAAAIIDPDSSREAEGDERPSRQTAET